MTRACLAGCILSLLLLNSASAFPATRGGVSEQNTGFFLGIGDSSRLAARSFNGLQAADTDWPVLSAENKPGVRWWWLGSAVDDKNLTWNLEELSKVGIGSVEITPIYGVQGNDSNNIDFLSPDWMQRLKHTQAEGERLNMLIDMNTGTGWPFGGPTIDTSHAASKQFIQKYPVTALPGGRASKQPFLIAVNDEHQKNSAVLNALLFVGADGYREQLPVGECVRGLLSWGAPQDGILYALFVGKTLQQVKRAAPGGQGLVMNHLSPDAVKHYLNRFEEAFTTSKVAWPHGFFNDSYEVFRGDWSENLLQEFKLRRGYDLADYLPEFLGEGDPVVCARVVCDYRETISDMLLNNFTRPWTAWAHSHGSVTRNQAHGSPGNLLDLYGAIDIPECESFGITAFDIPGFRLDSVRKVSDSNPATLKYASSAAHVTGKQYTSAESMTWLTEHFRTSLSQIKPEMDQLFLNGINRVFFHGSPYTPKEAAWPGWLFYASILVNPNNTIFRDMPALNDYAARVQSFLQTGSPDNEILLYFPVYDIWQTWKKSNYMTFDIHRISEKLPTFENVVFDIRKLGYDLDYVSDSQLLEAIVDGKNVKTKGGSYKLILVPDCKYMPASTAQKLLQLSKEGATVAFLNRLPDDVPGLNDLEARQAALRSTIGAFKLFPRVSSYFGKPFEKGRVMYGNYLQDILEQVPCTHEAITSGLGAGFLRRKTDDGHLYFIAQQQHNSIDQWVTLGVSARSAMIFNPVSGVKGKAMLRKEKGKTQVYLQLKPGESLIIKTFEKEEVEAALYPVYAYERVDFLKESSVKPGEIPTKPAKKASTLYLRGNWTFRFTEGQPAIPGSFTMSGDPVSWTTLSTDSATVYAGTGQYTLTFKMPKQKADDWRLEFGSLSESARIIINGKPAGTVWSIPYTLNVGEFLKPGKSNTIVIDVTNLPANRIADYDRRGVKWRIFKEINFVDVTYRPSTYDKWSVMPSGLTQPVRLVPLYVKPLE